MQALLSSDITEFKKLASEGSIYAQRRLAQIYYLRHDGRLAFHWWAQAARQGDPDSIFRVAEYFKNPEKRLQLYLMAANAGSARAQWFLGNCYTYGGELCLLNIKINEKKALYWYVKAAEQNYWQAQEALGFYFHQKEDFKAACDYYYAALSGMNDERHDLFEDVYR